MDQPVIKIWNKYINVEQCGMQRETVLPAECGMQLLRLNAVDTNRDLGPQAPEREQPRGAALQIEPSWAETVPLNTAIVTDRLAQLHSYSRDDPLPPSSFYSLAGGPRHIRGSSAHPRFLSRIGSNGMVWKALEKGDFLLGTVD